MFCDGEAYIVDDFKKLTRASDGTCCGRAASPTRGTPRSSACSATRSPTAAVRRRFRSTRSSRRRLSPCTWKICCTTETKGASRNGILPLRGAEPGGHQDRESRGSGRDDRAPSAGHVRRTDDGMPAAARRARSDARSAGRHRGDGTGLARPGAPALCGEGPRQGASGVVLLAQRERDRMHRPRSVGQLLASLGVHHGASASGASRSAGAVPGASPRRMGGVATRTRASPQRSPPAPMPARPDRAGGPGRFGGGALSACPASVVGGYRDGSFPNDAADA